MDKLRIISCGEVLWDLFPDGPRFGGAPANFACQAALLGGSVTMLSAVGDDERGREAIEILRGFGVDPSLVQQIPEVPTGTVGVSVDAAGKPTFEIHAGSAWDRIAWTPGLEEAIAIADAICFGTLGQRGEISRATLQRALVLARHRGILRVLDVNLRRPFFDPALIRESIAQASVLKLSDEELAAVADACDFTPAARPEITLRALLAHFGLDLVAMTRGAEGALLVSADETISQPGIPVSVRDTVGAGDAFTAALVIGSLRGDALATIARAACKLAAATCTHDGALPVQHSSLRAVPADSHAPSFLTKIQIVDSHTGGEPTRVVLGGVRAAELETYRRAIICEPRGHEVIVGALLEEARNSRSVAKVTFFNNVGLIGMCGHGMIGVVATLRHLGRITAGEHRIETAVGDITARLHDDGRVSVRNVRSFRKAKVVAAGGVTGDVAWGGNWFFLVADHCLDLVRENIPALTRAALEMRAAIRAAGFPEVDHVELFAAPHDAANHSRSFVLCPGGEYDRSPCGTGTSAKLACLAADGKLAPGEIWRQESIIGSVFEGSYEAADEGVIPTITGTAFITAEATLILDPGDPFRQGIA